MIKVALKTFRVWWSQDRRHAITVLPFQFAVVLVTVAWVWITTTKRQRNQLFAERHAICEVCPMYNPQDDTCGTIGHFADLELVPGTPIQIGCWCKISVAARIPDKTCWKTDRGLAGGWP